ncbi:MAG: type II toxin-antitoxin system RelE/ParE family toxin [Dehalococcoidia bacterium]
MADVVWGARARNDLASTAEYIAQDSPRAARAWMTRVIRATERLQDAPLSGRIVPEYDEHEIRELIVGNYRIIYRVTALGVEIARVWHGARSLTRDSIT